MSINIHALNLSLSNAIWTSIVQQFNSSAVDSSSSELLPKEMHLGKCVRDDAEEIMKWYYERRVNKNAANTPFPMPTWWTSHVQQEFTRAEYAAQPSLALLADAVHASAILHQRTVRTDLEALDSERVKQCEIYCWLALNAILIRLEDQNVIAQQGSFDEELKNLVPYSYSNAEELRDAVIYDWARTARVISDNTRKWRKGEFGYIPDRFRDIYKGFHYPLWIDCLLWAMKDLAGMPTEESDFDFEEPLKMWQRTIFLVTRNCEANTDFVNGLNVWLKQNVDLEDDEELVESIAKDLGVVITQGDKELRVDIIYGSCR
ncbi:hypothetical protein FPQ18DRAFT_393589 [Pyronema domesticum]|nr:hypothetical protein FPQ18DRAFT_393589 [Pyronema domesticum]